LVAGLVMVAAFLVARLQQRERRELARLVIDEQRDSKVRAA
jgi:hypothetical protein